MARKRIKTLASEWGFPVGDLLAGCARLKLGHTQSESSLLSPEEADRLYDNAPRTYLYGLEDGKTVIDGEGLGAYLNHSCAPNCEIDEIKNRAWIFALRNIAAGEELLWDYNLYDDDDPAPCYCGSPKCRGTMYSREWMARMRRKAQKKQLESKKKTAHNRGGNR